MSSRTRRLWLVLATTALVGALLVGSPKPAEAGLYGPMPADASANPVDWFRADDPLFVLVRSDIKGGRVCIVAEDATLGKDCKHPAWGTPNSVVGIGTMFVPIEAPPLRVGTWRLLSVDHEGKAMALSEPFTVDPCGAVCDFDLGAAQIAPYKEAARNSFLGAEVGCLGFGEYLDSGGTAKGVVRQLLKRTVKRAKTNDGKEGWVVTWVHDVTGKAKPYLEAFENGLSNPGESKAKEILKDLLCAASDMEKNIKDDPPDPDFGTVVAPELSTFANFDPQTTELGVHLDALAAHAEAAYHALEKYQGADAAADDAGRSRQARALAAESFAMADEMRTSAEQLQAYATTLDGLPGSATPVVDAEQRDLLMALFAGIRTGGFSASELDDLHALGMDDTAIANFEHLFDFDPAVLTPGMTAQAYLRSVAGVFDQQSGPVDAFARQAEAVADRYDQAPTVYFTTERQSGRSWHLVATAASPDGDPLSPVDWDFGDGTTGSGPVVDHTYAADGSYTVTATVHEPRLSASSQAALAVATNAPPVAVDDAATVVGGQTATIDVLGNDTDAELDPLAITSSTAATGGTASCDHYSCQYTAGYVAGTFGFDYVADDGHGGSDTGHVTVTVTDPPNHPPVVVDDVADVDAGGSASVPVLANDSDPEGDPLTLGNGEVGPGISASCAGTTCEVYANNVVGTTQLTYLVSDGVNPPQTGLVTVQIHEVNHPPTASPASYTLPAGGSAQVTLGSYDADGDPLTYAVTTPPAHGTLTGTPPLVTYTPTPGYVGTDSIAFTVDDGHATSAPATVGFVMVSTDVPPTVDAGPDLAIDEGTQVNAVVSSADPDGSIVATTFDWGDGTVDGAGSHLYADDGVYTVTVTVTDDQGATGHDSMVMTVRDVAPTLTASASPAFAGPGQPLRVDYTGTDVPADPLGYTVDFGDGTVTATTGTSITHAWAAPGLYHVGVSADDGDGGVTTATVDVTVALPTVDAGPDRTVGEGVLLDYPVTGTPAAATPNASWQFDWGDGSAPTSENAPVGHHQYARPGTYTVTVTAVLAPPGNVGPMLQSAPDQLVVTVTDTAPTGAAFAPPYARPGQPVSLSGGAFDPGVARPDLPDGTQVLTYAWDLGDGRAVVGPNPTVAYAAPGDYAVTMTVSDGAGGVSTVPAGTVHVGTPPAATAATAGTRFSLAFPPNLTPTTLRLFITGTTATTGRVVIPGLGFATDFTTTPGATTEVAIPAAAQDFDLGYPLAVQGRLAVLVRAEQPVTVYGLNRVQFTTDAYLALPDDVLGTDQPVLGYRDAPAFGGGGRSQVGVVASENGTTVTVAPSPSFATAWGYEGGTFHLDKGDVLLVGSTGSNGDLPDITGTGIHADKPVSVLGGAQCVYVPSNVGTCDHLVEQEGPTSSWGTEFVTQPLATRVGGDTFRILAAQDGTDVTVDGTTVATLGAGQFHEQLIDGRSEIHASKPVLVAQYANGTQFDGATADPFMMLVTPYEQFLTGYTVATPSVGIANNYLNVVVPQAALASLVLDGSPVDPAPFGPIGSSGFVGASLPVAEGTHDLTAAAPFGVWVYGFDEADSYGYPGGHLVARIDDVAGLALDPPAAGARLGEQACVAAVVTDAGGSPVPSVRVDVGVTGANPTSGSAVADDQGRATFCWTGTAPGTDTVTATAPRVAPATGTRVWRDPSANAAPTAPAVAASTPEDTPVTVTLGGADADADPLTWTIVSPPATGTLTGTGATRTFTPAANGNGTVTFTYRVSDGLAQSAPATVTITVAPVDDPPVGTNDVYTVESGSTLDVAAAGVLANDADADGTPLAVASPTAASHGAATVGSDGSLHYVPSAGFTGVDSFTYTPRSAGVDGAPVTVYVWVAPHANRAPTAADDVFTTAPGVRLDVPAPGILANDADPDGDKVTIEGLTSDASGGTLTLGADGALSFVPDAGFTGPFHFTYQLHDASATSAAATVTIDVRTPGTTTTTTTTAPVNHPPVAVDDTAKTKADLPVTIAVLANDSDPDGDALTLSAVGTPAHGTAAIQGSSVLYTPAAGYLGLDSFTYTVSDSGSLTAQGTVQLTVGPTGAAFHPVTPFRILDSRTALGGFGGPVGDGAHKTLKVSGVNGIPSSASAVVMNVTATGGTAASYLQLYPTGAPQPLTANVLFAPGQTIPNLATVGLGTNGSVDVFNQHGSVHVVADVVGWYDDGTGTDLFHAMTPARLLDSRTTTGGWASTPLGPNQSRDLQVVGAGGVPVGATGVVLNVTATGGTQASYVQAYPSGVARPTTANLLFAPGQTIPNMVTVAIGANGRISLYNQLGSVHLTVDVVAWFGPGIDGRWFHPITPTRLLDSRTDTGGWNHTELGPDESRPLQVTGTGVVPPDAIGFAASMAATASTGPSYLQLYPAGVTRPVTANVLFGTFETIPNMVTGATGTGGQVMIYNQQHTVDVVVDASGYYASK